jgi:hypothetical protein
MDADAGPPPGGPQVADVPVLSMNQDGAVSKRKTGKSGPSTTRARTAAKRKPDVKKPRGMKKAAAGGAKARSGKSFKSKEDSGDTWRPGGKVSGRKPSLSQKKTPKKDTAKKAAAKGPTTPSRPSAAKRPAAKKTPARRATRR